MEMTMVLIEAIHNLALVCRSTNYPFNTEFFNILFTFKSNLLIPNNNMESGEMNVFQNISLITRRWRDNATIFMFNSLIFDIWIASQCGEMVHFDRSFA